MNTFAPQRIIDCLSKPGYEPLDTEPLLRLLGVSGAARRECLRLLRELEDDGLIVRLRQKGYVLASSADLFSGIVSFTRSGAAYVTSRSSAEEMFVAKGDTGTALPGDRVLVRERTSDQKQDRPGRRQGKIIRVLQRNHKTIVGTLRKQQKIYYVEPLRASVTADILVAKRKNAAVGDRVLVQLVRWDDPRIGPEGDIVEVLGPESKATIDTASVIKAYHLPESFPRKAVEEAENATITEADLANRLDLRKTFTITIDPEDSRDHDDAISLEKKSDGRRVLGVHIADVSHFVTSGSALDKEARQRGNSVYLPDMVLPMLPEQLSNGLCSLHENKDRLAFSALMTVNRDGEVIHAEFRETIVRIAVRLTYAEALQGIQSTAETPVAVTAKLSSRVTQKLQEIHALAQKVRAGRLQNAALNLEIPDVRVTMGEDGKVKDISTAANDVAHQLVEECMLLANETVCKELVRREMPTLYRVHDEPDPAKLEDLKRLLFIAGIESGDLTKREQLAALIERIAATPQAHAWNVAILRSMKKAEYSTTPIGHYGLAKLHYTHFTSPIRRYADLVIHRLLKSALAHSKAAYDVRQLGEIAAHCSDREMLATEAERDIIELKLIRYFSSQLESGDVVPYTAVIVDVKNFGVFVDLPKVHATGMIHVSKLHDDFFDFNPVRRELHGRRSGTIYGIGSTLEVIIASVNAEKRYLDFMPCQPRPTMKPKQERRPVGKKSAKHRRRGKSARR